MGAAASTRDVANVEDLFLKLDIDRNGTISKFELRTLMEWGANSDGPGITALKTLAAEDEDGDVTLHEWKAMFEGELAKGEEHARAVYEEINAMAQCSFDERASECFEMLSRGEPISYDSLCEKFKALGFANALNEIDELFIRADQNCDSRIDKGEWTRMLERQLANSVDSAASTLAWMETLL